MKGPRMIIATTTEHGTDEDTEIGSRVTRSIADNFLRRPSLEDHALTTIATMANNDLIMLDSGQDSPILFDAAFVLIDKDHVRFLIAGGSSAFYFEDGELKKRSERQDNALFGLGPRYKPVLEPGFRIQGEKIAFLTASEGLTQAVSDKQITEALLESESPEDWMNRLIRLAGDKEFCAITAFLPPMKSFAIKNLMNRCRKPRKHE